MPHTDTGLPLPSAMCSLYSSLDFHYREQGAYIVRMNETENGNVSRDYCFCSFLSGHVLLVSPSNLQSPLFGHLPFPSLGIEHMILCWLISIDFAPNSIPFLFWTVLLLEHRTGTFLPHLTLTNSMANRDAPYVRPSKSKIDRSPPNVVLHQISCQTLTRPDARTTRFNGLAVNQFAPIIG